MDLVSGGTLSASGARKLRFLAVQVVGAVAVVHLVVGLTGFLEILVNGLLAAYLTEFVFERPRTLLFTLSGVAILAGMAATATGRLDLRRAYLLGAGVLATYLLGWVAWHTVLGHGLALSGGSAEAGSVAGHSHAGLLDTLRSHYVDPLLATVVDAGSGTPGSGRTLLGVVSATLEIVGLVVLGLLLRFDPAIEREGGLGSSLGLGVDRPAVAGGEEPETVGGSEDGESPDPDASTDSD
jgi:hypothetical protein